MARPLRTGQAGAYDHVISRGIERRAIFSSDASRQDFQKRLSELPKRLDKEMTLQKQWKRIHQFLNL